MPFDINPIPRNLKGERQAKCSTEGVTLDRRAERRDPRERVVRQRGVEEGWRQPALALPIRPRRAGPVLVGRRKAHELLRAHGGQEPPPEKELNSPGPPSRSQSGSGRLDDRGNRQN